MPQSKRTPEAEPETSEIRETKEELVAIINQQAATIADLREQLSARDAIARQSSEPGWLFTTKNPAYAGTVYGVRFVNGRGFLPKSAKDSERVMRRIVSDFGYSVSEVSASEFERMPAAQQPKNDERAFMEKIAPAQTIQ